jgi:hypothetical protein
MRIALVLLAILPLAACAGANHTPSDGPRDTRIARAFTARDECLTKFISSEVDAAADAGVAARAAAAACTAQTDKLVDVTNVDYDPRVAARIRRDSEFRAMGMILKARGQATN